jgi:oligopeptide/dipeptide ABC transporter ATP-binding protein
VSLFEVEGLRVGVEGSDADLLREVSFAVEAGEILGLVGETGSGKTMASLAIMGLLPPGIELRAGRVRVEDRELIDPMTGHVARRADEIAMIFQQPRSALNPTMRVGNQIARVLGLNRGLNKGAARNEAVAMLRRVRIPGAARVARAYPHQLSGGMCQRVLIAMALACRPRVLIADEPTTALDVTVQAQIFDLIRDLVAETRSGAVFITHDLAAVAEMCDDVAVLYGGQVMEIGSRADVLSDPRHPYTQFLLEATEREVDPRVEEKGVNFALRGCRFGHRCPHAFAACGEFPPMFPIEAGHAASCFLTERARSHATAGTG